jgi:hypothetical protein
MVGENFKAVFLFALAWLTTSCASDAPKAQVSLSNSPHLLIRRQTGSGAGQQPPPPDNCDFLQLSTFVNTSQCYITLVEDAFPSDNETTPGQLAEQYCTQSCAGNFIDFVMNTWNCKASQKEIHRLTLSRICSKNGGRRCAMYPFTDISLAGCELAATHTNPVCSTNCSDSILSAVNETGCCLALEVALIKIDASAPVTIDSVLETCGIQLPAACPLDYPPGDGGNGASSSSLSMLFVTTFVVMVAIIIS